MNIYINRIINGFIEVGLEAAFQLHLSQILDNLFQINTVSDNEENLYPIELKNKKISDSAPDLGNVYSYIDMFNLDYHIKQTKNVKDCYFIFLTDLQTYVNAPSKGTRKQLPMHDQAIIKSNQLYNVNGPAAIKAMGQYYKNGFVFSKDHKIEYINFQKIEKDY